jgi:selenocysteine lyase/cysteine desulfurase
VDASSVAVSSTVSGLIGLVAASIPDGARVVAPDIEFGSALFPFLAQEHRGVTVRTVPLDRLADAVDEATDVVVTSAVQMSNGAVVDLDAVEAAAEAHGAMTVVDATHGVGWLPIDASRFDAVACAAYKWLMSPRGTAFMTVRPERLGRIVPHLAGWYAGEDPHDSYFGPPLRLATSARRLDVSPAWHSWVGTVPALEVVERIGVEAIHDHDLRLANRFRAGLGLPPGDSAIVSVDLPGAADRLAAAGIMAAVRGGRLRTSWHVYNSDADVDAALGALLD